MKEGDSKSQAEKIRATIGSSDGGRDSTTTASAHRRLMSAPNRAKRHSLAIFQPQTRVSRGNFRSGNEFCTFPSQRKINRRSLAMFDRKEIAHLGAFLNRSILRGAVKLAAATAEKRAILAHSAEDS